MEGSGIGNVDKDWMHGGSGEGAGISSDNVYGGQSKREVGGVPLDTKKGSKKGNSKICAKDGCGARTDENKRRSRGLLVGYCSRDCQRSDWTGHKPRCNAEVEAKAAQSALVVREGRMKKSLGAEGMSAGKKPCSTFCGH
jgi:hypothetical protein